jgi:DNA recombination protein RmuC
MTLLIAFIAGAACATVLILIILWRQPASSLPQLAELERAVQQIRVDQRGDSGELRGLVSGIVDQQEQLVRQTGRLSEALRRPGVRGQWGETTLRQVVEAAGLAEYFDFATQTHLAGDGEQQAARPDLIVWLPGGGAVPVDAKVPLDAFLDAAAAETPAARDGALEDHVKQVRSKVRELSAKAYWNRFERAPEMVVMFIASEAAFAAAVQRDPRLIEDAARQKVVIVTPATMLALLQVVQLGWREHALSENTAQVRELATELIGRLGVFTGHLGKVGKALEQAAKAHNQAVGSLESRVLVTARKFDELGIAGEIPEPEHVATIPRLPAGHLDAPLSELGDAANRGRDAVAHQRPIPVVVEKNVEIETKAAERVVCDYASPEQGVWGPNQRGSESPPSRSVSGL